MHTISTILYTQKPNDMRPATEVSSFDTKQNLIITKKKQKTNIILRKCSKKVLCLWRRNKRKQKYICEAFERSTSVDLIHSLLYHDKRNYQFSALQAGMVSSVLGHFGLFWGPKWPRTEVTEQRTEVAASFPSLAPKWRRTEVDVDPASHWQPKKVCRLFVKSA